MRTRSFAWIILLTASLAMADNPDKGDCKRKPDLCQINIGGQILTLGMPKSETLALLSRTSYDLKEDRVWAAEHQPYSVWYLTVREGEPLAHSVRGGVRFKGEKLEGAMVSWTARSATESDVAANLTNLLERFSKEGFTSCRLSVAANARPPQEDTDATFQCGLRGLRIEHVRFNALFQGEKMPDSAAIYELLGNW